MKPLPMPKQYKNIWPGIFDDLIINAVPIDYIDELRVLFTDGEKWDIQVGEEINDKNSSKLQDIIDEFIKINKESISTVMFTLNAAKVKRDAQRVTRKFLKKNAL